MPDTAAIISSILSSVVWTLIGIMLLILAIRIFDFVDPVPYRDEVRKGNVAAGVVLAAVIIGMAVIIFAAIR